MKSRFTITALVGVSWAVFALAVVWPTAALVGRCIADGEPPDGGFAFSSRQLGLLWRSVWLSATATGLCLLFSLPAAYVVGQARRLSNRPLIAALLMAVMLCPPAVYAFGWERILPATFNNYARCVGVWALWAWPIPAMLIGAGWSRVGRRAFEAALMVTSPTEAFMRVTLPALRHYVAFACLILFVLFLGDYGVPHACMLTVYATELLGWARGSTHPIDTAWPALLSVAMTGLALLVIWIAWRRCAGTDDIDEPATGSTDTSPGLTLAAVACVALSWLLPVGALVVKLASPGVVAHAFRVYGVDLAWSIGLAVLGGLAAAGMGLGLAATHKTRSYGLIWAVAFGALPGAMVGESLVAAYNHNSTWWVYDYWPIIVLCYVSRFGWIGIVTALLVTGRSAPALIDQARTDGATEASILGRVRIPLTWPALLCGAGVVAALSVADVAASDLVRVPSFTPIAHILMEKFHRFEDGMLISLSLWLVAATWPAAILLAIALHRRRMA